MRLTRNRLTRIRYQAGISTAREAAELLGVSHIHLRNIESGHARASRSLVERMAKAYGVSEKRILTAMETTIEKLVIRKAKYSYGRTLVRE